MHRGDGAIADALENRILKKIGVKQDDIELRFTMQDIAQHHEVARKMILDARQPQSPGSARDEGR